MTTFVLVHGAWHDSTCWRYVAPRIAAAGHRVVTPDLTGHGARSDLLSAAIGLSTHVHDVIEAIEGHDLADVVLVGHSYAGMVISGVAEQVPDRVAQLVFVDGMVPNDGARSRTSQVLRAADERREAEVAGVASGQE